MSQKKWEKGHARTAIGVVATGAVLAAAAAFAVPSGRQPAPAAKPAAAPPTGDETEVPARAAGAAAERLRGSLEGAIRVPGWSNDRWSVLVMSLDYGDTLYSHAPSLPVMPASNMKLFTSSAALYYLGPEFRYGTYLATDGRIENGVLDGDLVVYGTGDPTLSDRYLGGDVSMWEAFADTLAALGVREIHGDVVGDASYFAGAATGSGWSDSYINAWYAAPASALTFNDNMVTLRVRPAEQVGWRPRVDLVPGGDGIALVNRAQTVASGRRTLEVTRAAYDGPIVVRGDLPRGSGTLWRAVPVADPARYAAAIMREALSDRGITVTGGLGSVHRAEESLFTGRGVYAPALEKEKAAPRVLAVHRSPSLWDITTILNKHSHNLYAEQLLRTVGRVVYGTGSVEAGHRAIVAMLEKETGSAPELLEMDDGSGLSTLNRTNAETLVHLLTMAYRQPFYAALDSTLPVAGYQGLRRMGSSGAVDNLRAKTGTIDNVSALSGYVKAANGEQLVFSIVSNEVPSTWKAKRVEDVIGMRLASFSRPAPAPKPIERAPAPDTAAAPEADSATSPADTTSPTPPRADTTTAPKPSAPEPEPEPEAPRTHVIKSGDTLEGIAKKYGTSVSALKQANPGVSPRRLIPGRELKLP